MKNLKIVLIKKFVFFEFFFETNIEKIIKYCSITILFKILIRHLILYLIKFLLILLIFIDIKITNINLKKNIINLNYVKIDLYFIV